jgi:hypothetical protein
MDFRMVPARVREKRGQMSVKEVTIFGWASFSEKKGRKKKARERSW